MDWIDVFTLSNHSPPCRAYVHRTGIEVFSEHENAAKEYLLEALHSSRNYVDGLSHILAAIWGDEGDKVIDFFGFRHIEKWPGNPGIVNWIVRNGLMQLEREITCGDGIIMLGIEEQHRRTTKSLDDYMQNPPRSIVQQRKIEPVTSALHS